MRNIIQWGIIRLWIEDILLKALESLAQLQFWFLRAIFAVDTALESIVKHSNEFIEYTAETANKLNDYALGGILPSLVPLMLFAYTQELMYVILFFFLLITSGIAIF